MKYVQSLIILLLASAAAVILCSTQSQSSQGGAAYTPVINPDIPQSVLLCGKSIDLDRTDMWERLDRELTSMAYTHGNTLLMLKRANRYFPVLAPILKANGVPNDALYLACIESTLNEKARSGVGAAGMWQFMESTAKQYGLEVNNEVDERYNLEKATAAACRYLNSAYRKYGDWPSAMASYNAGTARITKELEAQGVNTSFDLHLVDETSRYVFRIIAAKIIMEDPRAFGFMLAPGQLYQPLDYQNIEVSGPVDDWCAWAKKHGITYAQLREANPWIRDKKLTNKAGKTYTVKVPAQKSLKRSTQTKKTYNDKWIR